MTDSSKSDFSFILSSPRAQTTNAQAYLPYCDMVFPSAYAAVLFLLFRQGWVSIGAALVFIPIGYIVGSSACVSRGQRLAYRETNASKFAFSTVLMIEVVTGLMFLLYVFPSPYMLDHALACTAMIPLILSMTGLHLWTFFKDPGYLPRGPNAGRPPIPGKPRDRAYCETCDIDRPMRSKHCNVTDRCVARMDHYCPVMGTVIGEGNQRHFVAFLMTMAATQVTFLLLVGSYIARVGLRALQIEQAQAQGAATPSTWACWWRGLSEEPGIGFLYLLEFPLLLMCSGLAGRALYLAAVNLTVNEKAGLHKYPHFWIPHV